MIFHGLRGIISTKYSTCTKHVQKGEIGMKISEFVIGRNVEKQAVYRYLNRHEELLSKCSKEGKELEIPDEVVVELEKQYPLAKPVVVINGIPEEQHREALEEVIITHKKLDAAKEEIIRLQNELTDQKMLLLEQEHGVALLEEKNNLEKQLLEAQIDDFRAENEELKAKLQKMENRSFFERIFNRGV